MKIVCDACSAKYSIADEKVRGKVFKIRCKKCSNIIVVRGSSGAEQAEEQPQYDQKETKVFDYSGYDSPQEAASVLESRAAENMVWHVVIDQEQIGPMTADEVRRKFDVGEIDAETYIWKEGFGDWERLVDVAEFASLGGASSAAPQEAAGMFGGLDMDDGGTVQSDPADLFSAVASADKGDDPGSDLFGDVGGGPTAPSQGLFDAADAGGFAGGDEGAAPAPAAPQLTGQRNENSVLFSLNNLAALASDTPRASASPPLSSAGQPGMAQSGGNEGSGLIDIRSMAQVYLGDKPSASAGTGSADDLPVFSQGSFEAASPVLLPTASSTSNNKLLYALMGVIGFLVVAAAVLVIVVVKGGGNDKGGEQVASAAGAVAEAPKAADAEAEPVAAAAAGAGRPAPTEAAATEEPAEDAPEASAGSDDSDDSDDSAGSADSADKSGSKSKSRSRSRRSERRSSRSSRDSKPSRSSAPSKPERSTSAQRATASSGCDEVTCLVEPDKACCKKYQKGSRSRSRSASGGSSNLPDRPSRSDIKKGIAKVRGRVSSCGGKHGGKGTVKVRIKIGSNGRVASATASGGNSALGRCVASAVKQARFPKTQKGATVSYPFVF